MSHKITVAHTIGIDTGKNTLHLIGLDDKGAIVLWEKVARDRITVRLANVPQCLIGIEAGMATHYVALRLDERVEHITAEIEVLAHTFLAISKPIVVICMWTAPLM